jgi:uncharacterized protein (DUF488 family)
MPMTNEVYTIGHSTHPIDVFIGLLRRHQIEAVADVRSSPFSRFNPQFNSDNLRTALHLAGMRYVPLGKKLGARSDDPACYVHDKVQYEHLARTQDFQSGLDRLMEGAKKYRVALMCAEKEPLECHRTILVARHLIEHGCNVIHILADGTAEAHATSMQRLLSEEGLPEHDMFRSKTEILDEAYKKRGERIAYDRGTKSREEPEGRPLGLGVRE